MTTAPYEIGRSSDRCAATGEPLGPGAPFVAALFETPGAEALERRDYTPGAWESMQRPAGLFAFWRGVVPPAEAPSGPVIDMQSLMGLFEQLAESGEPRRIAFRYVLALILMRKRWLLPVGSRAARGDEPAVLLVRPKGAGPEDPPVEVVDPALDEATAADVTEQLRAALRLEA